MESRRFELTDEKSNKFWKISWEEKSFTVHYGKKETKGTEKTKEFDTDEACLKEVNKLIAEKQKKGYQEVAE